jgi:type I restriction enzyme S subunit
LRCFRDLANNFKGKLPSDLSPVPVPGALPYLLVEGFEKGEWSYTCDTALPGVVETDSVVVADGSRSGLTLHGQAGALGSTLLCYRPKEGVDCDFLFYLLQSFYAFTNMATIGGAVPHLDTRLLDLLHLYIPALTEEQAAIGIRMKALDEVLASTEAKVTAARRLKMALMQQLFSRGTPGRHTRFKQTKVGEIPEEWEVTRISAILSEKIYNGISPQSRPDPPGTPILNVSCISGGLCDPGKVTYVDLSDTPGYDLLAKRGDFFVLRGNGNRDYIATGGLLRDLPPDGCVFSDLLIKIPFAGDKTVEGFMPLLWQSSSFLRRLQSKAVSGSGLWKIGLREIRRHEFAKPSEQEQQDIVDLLSSADHNLNACETEVYALERLKRSLLQNLLTGKVRVKPMDVPS